MTQCIDKAAIVAEIERIMAEEMELYKDSCNEEEPSATPCVVYTRMQMLRSFLDTLDVKEVDLEAEARMKECPFRQVGCIMYEGRILECTGACSWVVDYPKLKELKSKHKEKQL